MVERKCLTCGTWNKNEDFCINCGAAISPKEIEKLEEAKREAIRRNAPKDKLDIILEKAKNSKHWYVRFSFYVLYSISFVIFGIGSIITFIVAWVQG